MRPPTAKRWNGREVGIISGVSAEANKQVKAVIEDIWGDDSWVPE
ncbi:hypothetical protein [Serratia marcescens]|nr:hypothetical protein [Serratia marcescens]OJH81901.1 hypothetical protein ASJ78_04701 [Serratia marcescens]